MFRKCAQSILAASLLAAVTIGALPAGAWADVSKTVPLLVIVVGFDGEADSGADSQAGNVPYDDEYDWSAAVFEGDDSLAAYYLDMSEGAFTFAPASETCAYGSLGNTNVVDERDDGVVHITLDRPHGRWGLVNEKDEVAREFGKVVLDAFRQASPFVDFASYDGNGDGLIAPDELAVVVCVAGYDASPFDDPDRDDIPLIWPHAGKLSNASSRKGAVDGVRIDSYIALAEHLSFDTEGLGDTMQEPVGILYHELGHYLGLPDLYALNEDAEAAPWGAYRVGALSLMDTGIWAQVEDAASAGGYRYEPTAFDAWSRYVLGWEQPAIATESGDYTVASELSEKGYSPLLIPTPDPDQYYLLENRLPEGRDSALAVEYADGNPRGGIVVWHIDKGSYLRFGYDNEANDTDHAPAVMEVFFESSDGRYTTDWSRGEPLTGEPFYDSASCEANFGSASQAIELPLHGRAGKDEPSGRTGSGITVKFPTEASREMTVHVEFEDTAIGSSSRAYPLDDAEADALRLSSSPLGTIAGAALAYETGADVGIVDAQGISAGLPAGDITYGHAYGVLPVDANIACYNLTGAQLAELAEESAGIADGHRRVRNALAALEALAFVGHVPDVTSAVPNADAALSFSGMTFEIDWNGEAGARIRNIAVGGAPVDPEASYFVATCPGVVEHYALFDNLAPDITMLWGSPADALRSFVEVDDWESAALG